MFAAALPFAAALGSSALGYFGQKSTNESNRDISRETNEFSARQAEINRQFQERMSNTSYQRARKDMEAAGFNPILAVSQGGASSPAGTSPAGTTGAPMQNPAARVSQSAIAALMTKAELDNIKEDTKLKHYQQEQAIEAATLSSSSAQRALVETQIAEQQLKGWKVEGDIDTGDYGKIIRYLQRILPAANTATSLTHALKPRG